MTSVINVPPGGLTTRTLIGCAAAWVDTGEKLGSGKLTLGEVLEPAIRLADGGYVPPVALPG